MPTFDAGTIDATLDLDRSPFSKGIERARQQGKRFEDRKLTVPLILDRSQWDKTLLAVRAQRDRFEKNGMNVDLHLVKGDWTKDLAAVRAQIKRLEANTIDIDVDITGMSGLTMLNTALTAVAKRHTVDVFVDITQARTAMVQLNRIMAFSLRDRSMNIDVDTGAALAKVSILKGRIDSLDRGPVTVGPVVGGGGGTNPLARTTTTRSSGGTGGTYGQLMQGQLLQSRALISGIAAIAPLATSAIGAAAGAAVALAAGLTAAAGIGVIGILPIVGAAIKAKKALDKQKDAQDAVTDAEKALAEADTADKRAAAAKDLAAAQSELKRVTDSLSPAILAFSGAQDRLTASWDAFVSATETPAFTLMANAFDLLSDNLGRFAPLAEQGLGVFQVALDGIGAWFEGPESEAMLNFFATTGVSSLESFLNMGGNLLVFFGRLFDAFSPLATDIMDGLEGMTSNWAEWAGGLKDSEGLLTFMDWVRERGGEFLAFTGALWDAVVNIGVALDPIAEVLLNVFTSIFDWIAGLDPGVLGSVLSGILAATVAFGALGAAIALVTIIMNANPITLIIMAIAGLVAGLVYAYNHVEGFRKVIDTLWAGIQTGALWVWNTILKPFFSWLGDAWEVVSNAMVWVWNNVLYPVIKALADAAMWVWDSVLKPTFDFISAAFGVMGDIISWVWDSVLSPVFNTFSLIFSALGATISWVVTSVIGPVFELIGAMFNKLWQFVLKPVMDLWVAAFNIVGDAIEWVWDNVLKPTFGFVGTIFRGMWENYLKPAIDAIKAGWDIMGDAMKVVYDTVISPLVEGFKDVIGGLKGAFDLAVDAIKVAWDKMGTVVKKPINFVVDTVINGGLVDNFNKIADFFGTSRIPRLQLPDSFNQYAGGGVLPGYTPGRDPHLFTSPTGGKLALSGGEAIMRPEWTRAVGGPSAVARMNAQARSGGPIQAFAGGGVWNNITNWVGNAASTVKNFATGAIDFVTDPLGFIRASVESLMDGVANNEFAKSVIKAPGKLLDMAGDKIVSMFSGGGDTNGNVLAGVTDALAGVTGGWVRPSAGPLTSRFGPRWGSFHNGIDIAGGGPTYAAGSGVVRRTGANVGYGNTGLGILIGHGNGLESYYGHNPIGGIRVAPGQMVTAGQRIGAQGATGNVTGIHLHHSIFQNGRAVDPIPFLGSKGVNFGVRDSGGPLFPGWNMMYNGTGENEMVLTGNQNRQVSNDVQALKEMLVASMQTGRSAPLVGGDLVLQAHKDEDVTSQFERVLFRLQTTGV